MNISSIETQFRSLLQSRKRMLEEFSPSEGIALMLDFYRDERVDNCLLEQDGDMLLFEWGCYDMGDGDFFNCSITRQLIEADAADDQIYQLRLEFLYTPTEEFRSLVNGNHWCQTPADLETFRSSIFSSPSFLSIQSARPVKMNIRYEITG